MNLTKAISDHRNQHPDVPAEAAARSFLGATRKSDLLALVTREVERLDRCANRLLEYEITSQAATLRSEALADPETWPARLRERIYQLGDGTDAFFGRMSAEQHRNKAGLLRKIAEGTLETARFHELAAETIEAAGVGCLDDLTPEQVPDEVRELALAA